MMPWQLYFDRDFDAFYAAVIGERNMGARPFLGAIREDKKKNQ